MKTPCIEINESIALDDSCQRKLFAKGHHDESSFKAACARYLNQTHAACCEPRITGMSITHQYLRRVPIRGNIVADSQHILSVTPGHGATPITQLEDWLPLHPCQQATAPAARPWTRA